jgi:NAD(P)-dependent dehydrogenase (short-subunit alcohol dehydrogenase family)
MTEFANKVVLITGASSGIGAGAAIHFSTLGASLALVGRNAAKLEETKQKCLEKLSAENVLTIIGDLTKEDACKLALEQTIKKFAKLDVLVNSAGILTPGNWENTTLEQFDESMNINVRSIFLLTQLAMPHLLKTKGNIVNVSSVTGLRAFPGVLSYNISKAALDQMTRCIALEVAPQGVRVNSVNPGVIVTEVHKRGGMSEEQYAKFLEHSKTTHALGRVGTTEEVAKSIAFLASDQQASFLTGVTLPVDGGRNVMCPR